MNEKQISNTKLLKRIDTDNKSYFFCPETYAFFSLPLHKADAFDVALIRNPGRVYDKIKDVIALRNEPAGTSEPDSLTESGLSLILTENCNLACVYCLQHDRKSMKNMPVEIALKAIDFLIDHAEAHAIKRIKLEFFGGEPLLNWTTLQEAMRYAERRIQGKDIQLNTGMITNGTLLKRDMIAFLVNHHCEITFSIDGTAQAHDVCRRTLNDKPTHKLVVTAIENTLEYVQPERINVLMTLHHENMAYLEESINYVLGLGINHIGVNPIRASALPDDSPLILTSDDYKQLATFLKQKYLEYPDLETNPYSYTICHRLLYHVNLKEQYHFRCGAGRSNFAVGIDGQMYPCSQFAFEKMMSLGNVITGIEPVSAANYVAACGTVDDSPICSDCWVRYFCGGGCYYEALLRQKDIRQPFPGDCLSKKTILEIAVKARIEFAEKYSKVQIKK